ncbi:MAG: hypothetical protein AAF961_15190 [Planctomycetota bacterium]
MAPIGFQIVELDRRSVAFESAVFDIAVDLFGEKIGARTAPYIFRIPAVVLSAASSVSGEV